MAEAMSRHIQSCWPLSFTAFLLGTVQLNIAFFNPVNSMLKSGVVENAKQLIPAFACIALAVVLAAGSLGAFLHRTAFRD